jgi:glycerate kinase
VEIQAPTWSELVRVVVAPDKFKHALSARDAAMAIARGVYASVPVAEIDICPLADGGEGSGEILAAACNALPQSAEVHDARMRPRSATWWWQAEERLAIVELAEAAGLRRLDPADRNPLRTTTFGVGELIRAAADAGAANILLAAGGSATVDGGAGALQALGWRLLDSTRHDLPAGVAGGDLSRIHEIVPPPGGAALPAITVLADVNAPLLGPAGAAAMYAPQKGAPEADVRTLEAGLAHWATRITARWPIDPLKSRYLGAAGGIAAGLLAAGASAVGGFDAIAARVDLAKRIAGADLVMTAEGRLDGQTLQGKVVAGVAKAARAAGVLCAVIAGSVDPAAMATLKESLDVACIAALHENAGPPTAEALARTAEDLEKAAAEILARYVRPEGC